MYLASHHLLWFLVLMYQRGKKIHTHTASINSLRLLSFIALVNFHRDEHDHARQQDTAEFRVAARPSIPDVSCFTLMRVTPPHAIGIGFSFRVHTQNACPTSIGSIGIGAGGGGGGVIAAEITSFNFATAAPSSWIWTAWT